MHSFFIILAAILPLRHKFTVRKLQLRYMVAKRRIATACTDLGGVKWN